LAGYKIYYEKSAVAYHKHSATSKKMPGFTTTQVFKNLPIVFLKNVPARLLWPIGWRFFIAYWLFYWFKVSKGGFVPATKGCIKSLKLWPHALRERKKIQRSRKVDVTYLREIIWPKLPFKSLERLRHPIKSIRKNS
jgi:GT2 family glycosyltransferase